MVYIGLIAIAHTKDMHLSPYSSSFSIVPKDVLLVYLFSFILCVCVFSTCANSKGKNILQNGSDSSKCKLRVLTVHGSADEDIPVEDAKEFAKIIPNHQLKIIKGADHGYSSHQDELASSVLPFIKESMQINFQLLKDEL